VRLLEIAEGLRDKLYGLPYEDEIYVDGRLATTLAALRMDEIYKSLWELCDPDELERVMEDLKALVKRHGTPESIVSLMVALVVILKELREWYEERGGIT